MNKLASHNSFTCYKAKGLFSKLFVWCGRCQRVSIFDQYWNHGVRLFDLRIRPDLNGNYDVCHGPIKFHKDELYEDLKILNMKDDVTIRVILEQNHASSRQAHLDSCFYRVVCHLKRDFPHIHWVGGFRKYDWKQIYTDFDYQYPTIADRYSSTTNLIGKSQNHWTAKLDDLFPFLYAKLKNKEIRNKEYDAEYLMIDFVDLG